MKSIGSLAFFFGAGSILLYFAGYEFTLLSWIENWGDGPAWGIRSALVVGGGLLWLLGPKPEPE